MAPHPGWPRTPILFAGFEADLGGPHVEGRFAVLRVEPGDIEPRMMATVLEGYLTHPDHPASAIAICGEDVYFTIGDGQEASPTRPGDVRYQAQQVASPQGKVLKYTIDGEDLRPADGVGDQYPIFALGFRNLFGIACGPTEGTLVGADNGYVGRDQVRIITAGSNHEWPFSHARDSIETALYDSGRTPLGPTGVAVIGSGDSYRVYFVSFHSEALYELEVATGKAGPLTRVHRFEEPPLSLTAGSNGCLYVGDLGSVWRVEVAGCRP